MIAKLDIQLLKATEGQALKTKENKYNRHFSHPQETKNCRIFIANSVSLESSRITYRYR